MIRAAGLKRTPVRRSEVTFLKLVRMVADDWGLANPYSYVFSGIQIGDS